MVFGGRFWSLTGGLLEVDSGVSWKTFHVDLGVSLRPFGVFGKPLGGRSEPCGAVHAERILAELSLPDVTSL